MFQISLGAYLWKICLSIIFYFLLVFHLAIGAGTIAFSDSFILSEINKFKHNIARAHVLIQQSNEQWNKNPFLSEEYAYEALTLSQAIQYETGKGQAYRALGVSFWARGKYDQALKAYLNAVRIWEQNQDTLQLAKTYIGIGLVYDELKEYDQALHYLESALAIFQQKRQISEEARCINNIGAVFFHKNQWDTALIYFQKALDIRIALQDTFGMAESYNNVGYTQFKQQRSQEALQHYFKGLKLWERVGGEYGKTYTLESIGETYMQLNQVDSAEHYLLQALEVGISIDNRKWQASTYKLLKQLEINRQNLKKALIYDQQYDALRDSLLNDEKSKLIAEIETEFETEKKEQELAMQQQKIEMLRQDQKIKTLWRNILALLLILLTVVAVLILRLQRIKRKKDRRIYEAEQALTLAELENAQLKAKKLDDELHVKNKELTSYSLNFLQKNELMETLREQISELKRASNHEFSRQLTQIKRLIDQHYHLDKEWDDFRKHFEQVHEDFFQGLKEAYPELTPYELKLAALMRLNLNMKEMASILGIAPSSVKVARHRIRKKLGLSRGENLVNFVRQFDSRAVEQV